MFKKKRTFSRNHLHGNISILDEPLSNISPHPKKGKCTTPDKTGINIPFTDVKSGDITNEERELRNLLPDVIAELRKHNQLDNWVSLNKLIIIINEMQLVIMNTLFH